MKLSPMKLLLIEDDFFHDFRKSCLTNLVSFDQVNGTKKSEKKLSADFPFSQVSLLALSSHWYQDWVKVTPTSVETC